MLLRFAMFFLAAFTIVGGSHAWLAWRLARAWPRRWSIQVVAGSGVLLPAWLLLSRAAGDGALGRGLAWAGFVHMGLFTLVFATFGLYELGAAVVRLADRLFGHPMEGALPADPARRELMLRSVHLGLLGLAGVQGGLGYAGVRRGFHLAEVDMPVAGLHPALTGFTIAQITDVHVGDLIRGDFVAAVVSAVNALGVDLVALTGDLVDGSVPELRPHVSVLADLKSRHGTYFCTGNHEYYSGVEPWIAELRRLGLVVLVNEHTVLDHDGAPLVVAGVTDTSAGDMEPGHESDVQGALDGAPDGPFRLLLAHQPRSVLTAVHHGVDLQLSGHTHGGQYFPGTVLVSLAHPYVRGLHHHEGRTWIYVSCGTGYWGPPFRLGSQAEITKVTLRRV